MNATQKGLQWKVDDLSEHNHMLPSQLFLSIDVNLKWP